MKKALLFLLVIVPIRAQTFDHFGGLITYPNGSAGPTCPGHPQAMTISTASRSGTTVTVVVSAVSSPAPVLHETFYISGTSTALDEASNFTQTQIAGSLVLTNISGTTLTLTSVASGTIGAVHTGTIYPAKTYPAQIGARWWYCTPEGHAKQMLGVNQAFTVQPSGKYPSDCVAAQDWFLQFGGGAGFGSYASSWGFNGVHEESTGTIEPYQTGCAAYWPFMDVRETTFYAGENRGGYANQPIKDLSSAVSANDQCPIVIGQFDPWDPNYAQSINTDFAWGGDDTNGASNVYIQSPWVEALTTVDFDFIGGIGGGPDFHTTGLPQQNKCDLGYIHMVTAPVMTWSGNYNQYFGASPPYAYPDPLNYAKTPMASPPANCDTTTPCSLSTFFQKKYTTTTAMNAAVGTTYTTFGTSGTCYGYAYSWCGATAAAETWGTGNGSTTSFSHTIAHTYVQPFSIQVILTPSGGVATVIGGDCGWTSPNGQCGSTANTGVIGGPGAWKSQFGYPVGALVTIGGRIGVATVGGRSGTSSPTLPVTVGSTVADGSVTWKTLGVSISSGSINYATGVGSITTASALQSGATLTINYVANGWPAKGTGLLDEDGSLASALGTNPYCMVVSDQSNADGHPVCGTGGDFPAPNANSAFGADLETWIQQWSAQFNKIHWNAIKAANPALMNWGIATLGAWWAPPNRNILIGAQPYTDSQYVQFDPALPDVTTGARIMHFYTQFYSKPMVNETAIPAYSPASPYGTCSGLTFSQGFATQAARGAQYYEITAGEFNYLGANGTYQLIGNSWNGSHDQQSCNLGLKDPNDNAYDGHEDVTGTVACSAPLSSLTCGGSGGNYGNAITGAGKIAAANALWYQNPVGPGASQASQGKVSFQGKVTH